MKWFLEQKASGKHQNYEKLVLNSKIQTYQILTNEAEVLNEVLLVLSLLYQGLKKTEKNKVTFIMFILKVDYLVPIFFLISYSLEPEIEICLQ